MTETEDVRGKAERLVNELDALLVDVPPAVAIAVLAALIATFLSHLSPPTREKALAAVARMMRTVAENEADHLH